MPAAAVLATILRKNASDAAPVLAPEGAVKPLLKAPAGKAVSGRPGTSAALIAALAAGGYLGGKAAVGDSMARAVDRNGHAPLIQGASNAMDAGDAAATAAAERVKDPFAGVGSVDPNSLPAAKPQAPGVLDSYWGKLKSGDPATVAGTGASALLAGVLTYNLLKKRKSATPS